MPADTHYYPEASDAIEDAAIAVEHERRAWANAETDYSEPYAFEVLNLAIDCVYDAA